MYHYLDAMRRYFDFQGKATRSQYWFYNLVLIGVVLVASFIDVAMDDGASLEPEPILSSIVVLAHVIPSLAISVRRLHDIQKSGWWLLLLLAPVIGSIILLVFMCTPSELSTVEAQTPANVAPRFAASHSDNMETAGSLNQLEKLASLRASGVISEDEFKQLKANVLARSS